MAFKKFLASSGLSTRRFGDQCGIGKTTVHRLAQPSHGGLTAPYVRRITPAVMDACRRHLESAGAAAGTIHRHLTEIFGDDFKPMINHRSLLAPEVLEFFGLARDPFAPPRSMAELFTTPAIESVYAQLEQAVRFQGFVCLLAPVGAGKTMLKNRLIAALGDGCRSPRVSKGAGLVGSPTVMEGALLNMDRGCTSPHVSKGELLTASNEIRDPQSHIPNPKSQIISPKFADMSRLTAAGIVAYVLEELGVKPRRALVLAQKQLEQRLAELAQNDISVALCFDECHRLNDTLLTALKNFYELGTGGFEHYLGLILFGQPQFGARLELPRFREIAERLACLELPAFSAETAENYLAHCLQNAHHTNPAPISDLGFGTSDLGEKPELFPAGPISRIQSPGSEPGAPATGSPSNPKSEIPHPKLFAPDAVRLIAARASTPLGIANAAAAAMLEAYKKGEPCVLARFVGVDETGPRAMRVGR